MFGYEDMLQEKIDMRNTKISKEKYLILKFFENHPEIIGQTCNDCIKKEQTCGQRLIEILELEKNNLSQRDWQQSIIK